MMKLFLVQHGEAKSDTEDPLRPLNEEGLRNAESVAGWMGKTSEKVTEIWHSGKRRAEQTAVIFGRHLAPQQGVNPVSDLNPKDDILPVADMLNRQQESLMIVGHLPFLDLLTNYLVTGNQHSGIVGFHNAGVVCLSREEEEWSVEWIVIPTIID